jgi:tRNA modification GTPase
MTVRRPQSWAMLATPQAPGAIAIIELRGEIDPLLEKLTGGDSPTIGTHRLIEIHDDDGTIDDCLLSRPSPTLAHVMAHGGPHIVRRLRDYFAKLGASLGESPHASRDRFPEADDRIEALALDLLSRAASPLAVDLLLDQPRRWRTNPPITGEDVDRSRRLDRLLRPPSVIVAGAPNVGKSTLSNRLLGRQMSIEADLAGTTRDYTAAFIDLGGLVVEWHDTPGLNQSPDAIESRAIDIAASLIQSADLLIAMSEPGGALPSLPRAPDLHIVNKSDLMGAASESPRDDASIHISARTGAGLDRLVRAIRDRLVPEADLVHPGPWLFHESLYRAASPPAPEI